MNASADLFNCVSDGYADSNGVCIHYVTLGSGPLVIMLHGFPDFWFSWRYQMAALADSFRVVAIDLRGYNLSDKPSGVDNYAISLLVGDVEAVIRHLGADKAVIAGHDWGGAIAWLFAMLRPEMTERLIICDLPHPRGLFRELAHNTEQQAKSQYARDFQQPGAEKKVTPESLVQITGVKDDVVTARYLDAFRNSDIEAMLNYYKANYPRPPYTEDTSPLVKIAPRVLMFHGLDDWALLPAMLNDTWDWLEQDLTLVTVPNAGHWVHWDAHALVTETMKWWLTCQAEAPKR